MEQASWSLQIIHVDQKYYSCRSKALQNLFMFVMQMGDLDDKGSPMLRKNVYIWTLLLGNYFWEPPKLFMYVKSIQGQFVFVFVFVSLGNYFWGPPQIIHAHQKYCKAYLSLHLYLFLLLTAAQIIHVSTDNKRELFIWFDLKNSMLCQSYNESYPPSAAAMFLVF